MRPPPESPPYPCKFIDPSFTNRSEWDIRTYRVNTLRFSSSTPRLFATIDGRPSLLHPLTLKPHLNLLRNFHPYFLNTSTLTSFHHTDFPFDRLISNCCVGAMLVLYRGSQLIGRLPHSNEWVKLSGNHFADIVVFRDNIYAVDIQGKLFSVNVDSQKNTWRLGKLVVSHPTIVSGGSLKRLVVDGEKLYLVACISMRLFRVYKLIGPYKSANWVEVRKFDGGKVLFVSKGCCFFMSGFCGREYRNCIVFSKAGFGYDDRMTEEIGVFRITDDCHGKPGDRVGFPEIDWSPTSRNSIVGSSSVLHARSQSKGEHDEEDGGVESDSKESNSEDEDEQEVVMLDSDSDQEQEERVDSEIQSDANIERDASFPEDVLPSLLADVAAVEEEVTKTLLRMSGGNEVVTNESSRRNITLSAPRACTSSTNKRPKIDTATAKFEGFEIRSDLVPILQKIWRNHGNIIENSTLRSADIITRALESLATVVQILENTSVQSLSDSEADYSSSTLSDLKFMGFKVHWLVSCVEKAVKLQKSKTLVDCLNKLTQLSHQVKDRRAMLLDEVTKLNEEENKLTKEMAKVSKLIPFSGQVKLDEPLGVGLT